jgi:molybdopterin converting factor subunit 1
MKARIYFFGATADAVGDRQIEMEIEHSSDVRALLELVSRSHPALLNHKLLFAVNEEYAQLHTVLNEGDEVAIFTPVSGG